MRTCPQSIVAQQERYDLGGRLWTCLYVLPIIAFYGWWITCMLDPSLRRGLKLFVGLVILVSLLTARRLNPWGRAARCRKASNLLGGNIVRYEVGESMSDADKLQPTDYQITSFAIDRLS